MLDYMYYWDSWTAWLIVLGSFAFYWYGIKPYSYLKSQGIPCRVTPLPLIGTSYVFFQQDMKKQHRILVADDRKFGGMYGGYLGRIPLVITTKLELVREICFKQFSNFTDRMALDAPYPFDLMILFARGDRWKNVRHKLTPAFSAAKLKETLPLMNECCDTLVEKMDKAAESGEPVDMHLWLQALTMEIITSIAFGVRSQSQTLENDPLTSRARRVFEQKMLYILSAVLPWPISSWVQKYVFKEPMPELCYLADVAREIIRIRKEQTNYQRKDLLQLMLQSKEESKENSLIDDEIVAQSCTFLIAGYETSSTVLGFLSYHLAVEPHLQDEIQRELDANLNPEEKFPSYETLNSLTYLDMVISETLRMYPPATAVNRECVKSTEVEGYKFEKGVVAMFIVYAIHMDPEYYPDPEKFDPLRFTAEEKAKRNPLTFAPFGYGPRNCIGMRLAMMEMKLCLVRMLKNHRLEVCPQTKIPMEPVSRAILSVPERGVVVRVVKRE